VSRIGRKTIPLPKGVTLETSGRTVTAKSAKGAVQVSIPESVSIKNDGKTVAVEPQEGAAPGAWGLTRSLVANAIEGVTKGFEKRLLVVGVGYRAEAAGSKLTLMVGFSHPVVIEAPSGVKFSVEQAISIPVKGSNQAAVPVIVRGMDKQLVGDYAARVRAVRPPEPYLGKGIRYLDEQVRTDKTGKSAK